MQTFCNSSSAKKKKEVCKKSNCPKAPVPNHLKLLTEPPNLNLSASSMFSRYTNKNIGEINFKNVKHNYKNRTYFDFNIDLRKRIQKKRKSFKDSNNTIKNALTNMKSRNRSDRCS